MEYEIRKSDSKGRVSVGIPNVNFKVHKLGGTLLLEAVIDPVDLVDSPAPKPALDYLESFGLDPMLISRTNANSGGYDQFEQDWDTGRKKYQFGTAKVVRKPWPEGFDWNVFIQLAAGTAGGGFVE